LAFGGRRDEAAFPPYLADGVISMDDGGGRVGRMSRHLFAGVIRRMMFGIRRKAR
jgi:hypothetical protein